MIERSAPVSLDPPPFGYWHGEAEAPGPNSAREAIADLASPVILVDGLRGPEPVRGGTIELDRAPDGRRVLAIAPSLSPSALGDPAFGHDWGVAFPYVAGAMANGIASEELVEAIGHAGMLGFFGAAGLSPARVDRALTRLGETLGRAGLAYGANLIHSPQEPALEREIAELFLRHGLRRVEASAYLNLTVAIVRYRTAGIHRDEKGRVVVPNRVMAKVSRIEVARRFLSPPPEKFVATLVAEGHLTEEQAELARHIPMADDITAEADSGGHTDNRPLTGLLPVLIALRDQIQAEHDYPTPPRVGAAGGIATPAATAAAFAMGAAYVVVGTVHQSCLESGTSDTVRTMLAQADPADIAMAPAADMFEMGVKVQVLKRGTLFAMRATKLYELYRTYESLEAIPAKERETLTQQYFLQSFDDVWAECVAFFRERDPRQLERAAKDERHRMALVFRWYLGQSSHWANRGDAERKVDYQVWCGPSMGAFNQWTLGTFLAEPSERSVVTIAYNLLHGAAVEIRRSILRSQGIDPALLEPARPRRREELASAFRFDSATSMDTRSSESAPHPADPASSSRTLVTETPKDDAWR